MKFLLGSHFWKMNIQESDKDYIEYIYPSRDYLFNCKMVSIQIKDDEGNDINVKDIRMLLKELKKGSLRAFEVINSNPIDKLHYRDKLVWGYLKTNKYELFNELRVEFMRSVFGEGKGRIKQLEKNMEGKDLAHLQKLYWILYSTYNFQDPFNLILTDKNTSRLIDIRNNPKEELFLDLKEHFKKFEYIDLGEVIENKPRVKELEKLIKDIIFVN